MQYTRSTTTTEVQTLCMQVQYKSMRIHYKHNTHTVHIQYKYKMYANAMKMQYKRDTNTTEVEDTYNTITI